MPYEQRVGKFRDIGSMDGSNQRMLCQVLIPLPLAIFAERIPWIGHCIHIPGEVIACKVHLIVGQTSIPRWVGLIATSKKRQEAS